ncbi:2-succinyl-6-hydroxy-2,4-cyclohexadiene-1-carboxylate synthase [Novosphingobium chloroacetimidivorans]|uniref:2-succinyl-6-hydroxy-2, 4-cyclohexadiene-1-carboxylate synthase n=1 Tax=Novosphingobium chloroacetimidivorans TaxID=1428314 RepID=A0A7W7NYQ8_9SPHN|nr:alpha/beta hydrolase [Novosphingobium chloroacetimidivorans]MBB4860437.1 2-succinyl-6-hydroxy-2,4-cyclohexadiene-1-carboxylate synthase [Novosphingobium chloroacetimidivorans]
MRAFSVDVEGAQLAGERRDGEGPPLVLAHGFGGARHDWEPVLAALPPDMPVVVYDQRGFGSSTSEPGVAFSHAEDLLALLDALDLPLANLCGLSLGGATVLGAAILNPARVHRLALVSPMLAAWSWSDDWVEQWKAIGQAARGGNMARARTLWFEHPLFGTTRALGHGDALRTSIEAFAGRQWIRDDQRAEVPMVERLHVVDAATLLLTGARDLPDFRLMADLIEAAVPNVTRIDDPRCGHLLTLEAPDAIAEAIASFLRG